MRLFAAFALGVCATASAQVTVDEQATRAELVNGAATVSLALRSSLDRSVKASVLLDWIDPDGKPLAHAAIPWDIAPGESRAATLLPLSLTDNALFYRLRYTVRPDFSNLRVFDPQEGVIAFPQIALFAFRLRAIGIGEPRVGQPYEFRVFAEHPVTHAPIAGVEIVADDDRKSSATTDAKGEAVLRLMPDPKDWDEPDDITLNARLGDLTQRVEARRPAMPHSRIQIYTDKPLYQPGQTLHARILAIGSDGKARSSAAYEIRIRDERETLTHAANLTTSRFGIASTDWEIPPNAMPGSYQIEVSDADSNDRSEKQVEVRRYELPTLRVTTKADRGFYLPGQSASVEIRGEYLFGKPVANGKVRVSARDGNEALCEGELDSSGKFVAKIDLKEAHAELAKEYFGSQYSDYHYQASVTDPLTNHTEQGRFDLRVSRQADSYLSGAQ